MQLWRGAVIFCIQVSSACGSLVLGPLLESFEAGDMDAAPRLRRDYMKNVARSGMEAAPIAVASPLILLRTSLGRG